MNYLKLMVASFIAAPLLWSCKEDEPIRLEWNVASSPVDNFEIFYSPEFHPSVMINAALGAGEVTLTCTNFTEIFFDSPTVESSYDSEECGFSVTKTEKNVLKFTFEKLESADDVNDMITVCGNDGHTTVYSSIMICHKNIPD